MTLRMSCGADSGRSRMAKIRLTDYLKSKRKKEEVLFESEEDILRRARRKMEADQFIISPAYRIENFRQAEKLVSQIPDYEEAGELKEQFRSKRQKAELEKKEWDLRRAHLHFDQARTEDEFKKVQEEFSLLGDYGDAAHFCEQAQMEVRICRKKTNRKRLIGICVAAAVLAAVLLLFYSGLISYAIARMEGMSGVYVSARNRMQKLGSFLDAEEQAEFYNQKYLEQRTEEEKTALNEAQEGDTVDFGDHTWLVAERNGSELVLLLKTIKKDGIFGPREYSEDAESYQWQSSSLRAYLNEKAILEFSEAEQTAMVTMKHTPSGNLKYKIDGGPETEDWIRIPDSEEAEAYLEKGLFSGPGADVWLCSPGHGEGTASFLTKNGEMIEYGNDVTDDSLSVLAMICVDYSKLGQ